MDKPQPTLELYTTVKKDLCDIVAKLATVDGFSIRSITRSEFIRQLLSLQGMMLPKTEYDVQQLIINKYTQVKSKVKNEIKDILHKQGRFLLKMVNGQA